MTRRSNGEGSYFHNKQRDYWRFRLQTHYMGNYITKEFTAKTKPLVKAKADIFLDELKKGNVSLSNNITIEKLSNEWLNAQKPPTTRPSTYSQYKSLCSNYIVPQIGYFKLKLLNRYNIQEFLNNSTTIVSTKTNKKLSRKTIADIRICLRAMLNFAVEDKGYIPTNPVTRTKIPDNLELPKEKVALSKEQIDKLLTIAQSACYINKKYLKEEDTLYFSKLCYAATVIMLAGSLRLGECFGITNDNISFTNKSITINKALSPKRELVPTKTNNSVRTLPMPPNVMRILKAWLTYQRKYAQKWANLYDNNLHLLFPNSCGKPINFENYRKRYWDKLCKAAKMPEGFTPHSLRHTAITQMILNNVDIKTVQMRAGHASIRTTLDVYTHVLKSMDSKAINIIDNLIEIKKGCRKNVK